jgi:hypothetical protein
MKKIKRTISIVTIFLFTNLLCEARIIKPATSGSLNGVYKFSGKINGKIPVFLWFVVQDSVLKGEVTYLKTAKRIPITVAGTINNEGDVTIYEYTPKGYITGIYKGKFDALKLEGIFSALNAKPHLRCLLLRKDTVLANIRTDLQPTAIDGEYLYRYGENGAQGGLTIKQVQAGEYDIEINCVTASPANNIADIEKTRIHMTNNCIIYKSPDEDCGCRIRVYNGFIVIDVPSGKYCEYGVGATVEGVFFKTSSLAKFQ